MKVKEESEKVGLKLNIQKTKTMTSGPITSWEIDGKTVETVADFLFWGCKITADGDCSHEIKRCLLLGRKVITNLAAAKSHQSCSTLCEPIEGSPPGTSIPGILQARVLEWGASYIMRNARLDEAQAGIKISGRNINNLRYADDTTLMAESEEGTKKPLDENERGE